MQRTRFTPQRPVRSQLFSQLVVCSILPLSLALSPLVVSAIPEKAVVIPPDGFAVATTTDFRLEIPVEGELVARENATVVSTCEWFTRVIWLIPEGTWVEKGDIICELDRSELEKELHERELRFIDAEAMLAQSHSQVQIQELLNASNIATSELNAHLTQLDHVAYTEAQFPKQLHTQQSQVALLQESLLRAEKMLEFNQRMQRLGYRTAADVEKQRLDTATARQQYEVAVGQLNLLENFTKERQVKFLEGQASEAKKHRSRVEQLAESAILTKTVQLHTRQKSLEIYRSLLDRFRKNLEACTIRAPQTGEIVYAMSDYESNEKVHEGSSAYLLRPLVHIPDRRQMNVTVRVHESLIRHVQTGAPAKVTVAALQGKAFTGTVSDVAKIPVPGRYPRYDLREYKVQVTIEGEGDSVRELAPGLTAKVEVLAAHKPGTLVVPVDSVVQAGGRFLVFVREGDDVTEREVLLGLANDKEMEIVGGLESGEQVVLQPRARCADLLARIELARNEGYWGD